jgi:hypothetical protein
LKQTGECFVSLPEALFDLDYPGHYMRRIKSVAVTIPCVTGPYTGVNCTLTLHGSTIRYGNALSGGKYARQSDDARFSDSFGAVQSIVTSGGQNDSGLFEASMRDERYLPFEGQGAISAWRIELPKQFKSFDHDTISDVVLHLRYTAREGGELLKTTAIAELNVAVNAFVRSEGQKGLARAFSLRHEFPSEWHRFLNPPPGATADQTLTLALTQERFPLLFQEKRIAMTGIELYVKVKQGFANTLKLSLEAGTSASNSPLTLTSWNSLLRGTKSPAGALGNWTLTAWSEAPGAPPPPPPPPHLRLDPDAIEDIALVCSYTIS